MNVLMVGPMADSGGVAVHTGAIVRELEKEGHRVLIFSTMTKRGWRPGRSDPITIYDNILKLGKIAFGMPIFMLRKRREIDVIHIQSSGGLGGFLPAVFGSICGRMMSRRVLITFHYSKTEEFARRFGPLISFVAGISDGFILVSERQRSLISDRVNPNVRKKLHVIPNGFDPERLRKVPREVARRILRIDEGCAVATNIAWVMEKKGHIRLIEALERVVAKGHKVKVFVIGKGPLLERMRDEVRERGLEGSIVFTGFVRDRDLVLYMSASDFFVLSSYEEGNPLVMFEALGMGLPFVGTCVGGIPEIIRSERHGILVQPNDSRALSYAMEEAIRREWDREAIARYGGSFSWENIAARTIELYRP